MPIDIKLYCYRNGERQGVTDIRRLRLQEDASYEVLVNKITEAQSWVKEGNATFKYVDEENDLVQFSSNGEWQIALEVLNQSNDKILRLRVAGPNAVQENRPWQGCQGGWRRRQHCPFYAQCGSGQQADLSGIINAAKPFIDGLVQNFAQAAQQEHPQQPAGQQSEPLVRHFGVVCDGCEQENIIGARYKCNDCDNFDYCSDCYNSAEMRQSHGESHKFTKIDKPVNRSAQQPEFNFAHLLNHPLAQQFIGQFQGNQQQQFNIEELIKQYQPVVQQFAQSFGQAQQPQQFNLEELIKQYQPFVQQFVQDLSGQGNQQEQPQQPAQQPQPSAPVQQEEEIVIDDEPQLATPQVFPYQAQLEQLESMGFVDTERNKDLLVQYGGNIARLIQTLLSQ